MGIHRIMPALPVLLLACLALEAKNTEWARGSNQWVGWIAKGGHWGGYTYRLCKLPEEGKTGLTEECFAKNVLEFASPKTWWKRAGDEHVNDAWQTVSKTDLVEGTYPEGSAWRQVVKVVGQGKQAEYLIRKDKVKVPENLPKGDYVLSFRWDQRELHKCGCPALLSNLSENQDHEIGKGNYQKKYMVN